MPFPKGENHPLSKLKEADIVAIRDIYASGDVTTRELARLIDVSPNTIWMIVSNRAWRHVPSKGSLR